MERKKLRNLSRNTTRKVKMLDSVNNQRQNDRVSTRLRITKKRVTLETAETVETAETAETLEIEEIIVSGFSRNCAFY